MDKARSVGLVEIVTISIVLIGLWYFTDFKSWLLDEGGIVKVVKELIGF